VLDVVMPRLGGTATAEKLLQWNPGLLVIFTSGYSRDRDERTAKLPQASYLQKTCSPTHLGKMVRAVRTRPRRASKSHATAKWENPKSREARMKLH
jgi:CheY-like chemotaxis protein